MSNALSINDLTCHNCSKYGTEICPDKESDRDFPCLHHPFAFKVLAHPIVEELNQKVTLARTIPKNGIRIYALKEAITLIQKGGKT